MSEIDVKTTVNFEFIQENFNDCRGIVLPGGTRSSKTIATLQWIIYYCLTHQGKHIVICRDTLTNLKRTTLTDWNALCLGHGPYPAMAPKMKLNKSEMIGYLNGNIITFIGLLDDPMRAYGLRSDIFYINEAVSTYKHTFSQLNQRCEEGFILDCNPSAPNSWVYELEKRPDVKFFRTTYLDNPFLPEEIVNEITAYEPTPENEANGTADEKMWSIYGKGLVFKGPEIIYPKWTTYDEDPTEFDNVFYGLDWGFNHPLAVVQTIINGKNLYIRQIIYQRGIKNLETGVADPMKKEKYIEDTYLVCDSSEPRSINELVTYGLPAFGVKKPPGSVNDGIRKVQGMNIHVHVKSTDVQDELNNYKWKVDTKTGDVMDVPVKEDDDAMDATRYPVYTFA